MGIYANFFLCEQRGVERIMGYVGSTFDLHKRVHEHRRNTNYTLRSLPKVTKCQDITKGPLEKCRQADTGDTEA
jgi:hypothetical protein